MSTEDDQPAELGQAHASSYTALERDIAQRLIVDNYEQLVQIARQKRRRADGPSTLATIDLLHEGLLKLGTDRDWHSREHFLRSANLAMRCVIVDHARRKQAAKRGGDAVRLDLDEALLPEFAETPEQVVAIAELLNQLAAENERWMLVVDARYFSGMTETETALALGISERTARRDWQEARQWLARRLGVAG
ncbi:MAG: ECF-type sigma factor [Pseudomonadota bacterium]